MRLLLDEMYAPAVAEQLARDPAIDVMSMDKHRGLSDEAVLTLGAEEARVVVTENVVDFIPLANQWIAMGKPFTGLIFTSNRSFPGGNPSTAGKLVRALRALAESWADYPGQIVRLQLER